MLCSRLPQQLLDALVKILLVADKPKWQKLVCASILQELAPCYSINLPVGNLPWDDNQIPYILMVALNQVCFYKHIIAKVSSVLHLAVYVRHDHTHRNQCFQLKRTQCQQISVLYTSICISCVRKFSDK